MVSCLVTDGLPTPPTYLLHLASIYPCNFHPAPDAKYNGVERKVHVSKLRLHVKTLVL